MSNRELFYDGPVVECRLEHCTYKYEDEKWIVRWWKFPSGLESTAVYLAGTLPGWVAELHTLALLAGEYLEVTDYRSVVWALLDPDEYKLIKFK